MVAIPRRLAVADKQQSGWRGLWGEGELRRLRAPESDLDIYTSFS
jgi:hypothetical protein